jgi:cobalt-precorrin-5B (C1)-methyltransferase
LNQRIGIKKGISILGTTGIVVPYSIDAYTACISQGLDVAVACGCRRVVLTTGRRSEKYAQKELGLPDECFIQAGDFIGYCLKESAKRLLDRVIVWGMTGKISKLAAGNFYTNISDSRVNIGFLVKVAAGCCVPEDVLDKLRSAVTANHLRRMLPSECVRDFCNELCRLAAEKSREETGGKLEVEYIMSDYDGIVLGRAGAEG